MESRAWRADGQDGRLGRIAHLRITETKKSLRKERIDEGTLH